MARKSLLSAAIERPQAEANENTIPQPVADAVRAEAKRPNSNAGKYHLGGYFDQDDPTAEAFRVLAAKTRRKPQDLLRSEERRVGKERCQCVWHWGVDGTTKKKKTNTKKTT